MGRNLCPDKARTTIAIAAAALLLFTANAAIQIGVIFSGGLAGWWLYRKEISPAANAGRAPEKHRRIAGLIIAVFFLLLIFLPALAGIAVNKHIAVFDSFYRAGSLVFGGGHVVLPLLRAEVVPPGWVTDDKFLAGYGVAQAVPGPLFTFAAYLGTVIQPGSQAWLAGLWCLLAIFLPAWLLIAGALPFWHQLRTKVWAQAALRGANAAVVGVLLAALYNPVWVAGVNSGRDAAMAIVAFALLHWWKVPPWLVVLLAAAAGNLAGLP
jgi:chromate transporter